MKADRYGEHYSQNTKLVWKVTEMGEAEMCLKANGRDIRTRQGVEDTEKRVINARKSGGSWVLKVGDGTGHFVLTGERYSAKMPKDRFRMARDLPCTLITHNESEMTGRGNKLCAGQVCILLCVFLAPSLT